MERDNLDHHWSSYQQDPTTTHTLLTACITFARQRISASDPHREDIAHAAAWKAWTRFNTLPATINFSRWFSRVLKNTQRDAHRAVRIRCRHEQDAASTPIAEPVFTLIDKARMLDVAGEQREVVSLLLKGNTLDEVADQLNLTVRTIRRRLNSLRLEVQANG